MSNLNCPGCGHASEHRVLFAKNDCLVYRCGECGLGRAEVSSFDPLRYYTRQYFDGTHPDGYADYAACEPVLREEFAHLVELLASHGIAGGRLLEIGCAYGFFLQEAKRRFEVFGAELAEDAVESCHRHGLSGVRQGPLTDPFVDEIGKLDAVVLLDVIEHLPDPVSTLRTATRHLRPGGIVMLTTGDFGSMAARVLGPRWRLLTPPQHLWFFTRNSLQHIAEQLGFEVISFAHPAKKVPLGLMVFQFGRMIGTRFKLPADSVANRIGLPVNLFDSMRVLLRKKG